MVEDDEIVPLLGDNSTTISETLPSPRIPDDVSDDNGRLLRKIALLLGLLIVLADLPDFMRIAPKLRLFELNICRDYYLIHDPSVIGHDGSVPEMLCKIEQVQQDLAMLRGWLNVFEGIPGLLVAIPYGILADSKGRRFVVALNMLGQWLGNMWIITVCYFYNVFPIKAVWASGVFQFIGGGGAVLSAMTLAIIADVAPASKRSTIFFFFAAAMLITEVVAPLSGSFFLSRGYLYLPMFLGIPMEVGGFFVIWILPETLRIKNQTQNTEQDPDPELKVATMKESILQILGPAFSIGRLALTDIRLTLALFAFMVNRLQRQILDLMVQYASTRLHWTVAKAGYLVSFRAGINICVLLLILPLIIKHISPLLHLGPNTTDLWLAKASGALMVAGCLMIGFSNSAVTLMTALVVFTFGSGFRQLIQSYTTSLVSPSQIGSLYTLISIIDGLGAIGAAALLSSTFATGIKLGGVMQGLPFFVAAGLYTLASIGVWSLWAEDGKT